MGKGLDHYETYLGNMYCLVVKMMMRIIIGNNTVMEKTEQSSQCSGQDSGKVSALAVYAWE